ncbi:hypothetical protein FGO68_gene1598 [Halteria grandinella]|uniref:Uncharacterized protein n=1 Tax=Halteria grandinella TaxID=5974 RepID=A0A8J8T6F9_HALGN|nr:hypothetical protein FGO68_gene1598 [Halteria grandinella]
MWIQYESFWDQMGQVSLRLREKISLEFEFFFIRTQDLSELCNIVKGANRIDSICRSVLFRRLSRSRDVELSVDRRFVTFKAYLYSPFRLILLLL